jgi:hypothetical protein
MKALNAYPLSLDLNRWEREVMLRMDVVCEHIQDIAQSGRRRIFFATNDISFFCDVKHVRRCSALRPFRFLSASASTDFRSAHDFIATRHPRAVTSSQKIPLYSLELGSPRATSRMQVRTRRVRGTTEVASIPRITTSTKTKRTTRTTVKVKVRVVLRQRRLAARPLPWRQLRTHRHSPTHPHRSGRHVYIHILLSSPPFRVREGSQERRIPSHDDDEGSTAEAQRARGTCYGTEAREGVKCEGVEGRRMRRVDGAEEFGDDTAVR